MITEATKKYDIADQICNECNDWNTADDPIIFSRHGDPKHLDHNPETDRYVTDKDTQYTICSGCFSDIMESDVLREKAYNTILDTQTRNLSKLDGYRPLKDQHIPDPPPYTLSTHPVLNVP